MPGLLSNVRFGTLMGTMLFELQPTCLFELVELWTFTFEIAALWISNARRKIWTCSWTAMEQHQIPFKRHANLLQGHPNSLKRDPAINRIQTSTKDAYRVPLEPNSSPLSPRRPDSEQQSPNELSRKQAGQKHLFLSKVQNNSQSGVPKSTQNRGQIMPGPQGLLSCAPKRPWIVLGPS